MSRAAATDMRWEDALFEQVAQKRFLESRIGIAFMIAFERSFKTPSYPGDRTRDLPDGFFWVVTAQTLERAEPIYVSPDVTEIIDHAREQWRPEIVLPQDAPTPCGFAVFPRPIEVVDAAGQSIPIKAIGWLPILAQPDVAQQGERILPGNTPLTPEMVEQAPGCWITMWTDASDDTGREITELNANARMSAVFSFFMPYHESSKPIPSVTHQDAAQRCWSLIQVFWRLSQQLVSVQEVAPRAFRREAKRYGLDRQRITVVKLRRARNVQYGDGDGRPLDHRHIVHGHWKRQWYPSLGQHRQIFIAPYVRGPEDGELRLHDRAFEFVR